MFRCVFTAIQSLSHVFFAFYYRLLFEKMTLRHAKAIRVVCSSHDFSIFLDNMVCVVLSFPKYMYPNFIYCSRFVIMFRQRRQLVWQLFWQFTASWFKEDQLAVKLSKYYYLFRGFQLHIWMGKFQVYLQSSDWLRIWQEKRWWYQC